MDRYTKKDARNAFERFCKHFDYQIGYEAGCYTLDDYGGFKIVKMTERGGEDDIFGSTRLNAREFCQAVRFLERALQGRKVTPVLQAAAGYPLGLTA